MATAGQSIFSRLTGILTVDDNGVTSRSGLRYRRIALSAFAGLFLKVIALSTGFISVPLALRYLGKEQFGIWMTFTGFIGFLQFTDLGLGIGLQNHLTSCYGMDDRVRPKRLVSSTLAVMISTATLLILAALLLVPALPLQHMVRTATAAAAAQLVPCARMFVIAFAFVLPLGLVQYICNAYQRGYIANSGLAGANLLVFAGVLIGITARMPLWWFIFLATLAPALAFSAIGAAILSRKPWLRPAMSAISLHEVRRVVAMGLPAFGAQTGGSLMMQGPTLVIASVLGAAAVGPFALSQQLLSVSSLLLNVVMAPLWPAYGEAAVRRDVGWIKRAFKRSVLWSFIMSSITFVIVGLLGRTIIRVWTRQPDMVPTLSLLMACASWTLVIAWIRSAAMLVNGLGRMVGQCIYGTIIPAFTILLAYRFGAGFGTAGVIWTVVIIGESFRAVCFGVDVWFAFRSLRNVREAVVCRS